MRSEGILSRFTGQGRNRGVSTPRRAPIVPACVVALVLVMAGGTPTTGAHAAPETPNAAMPIVIATNHWATQQVVAAIAGKLLERLGHEVRYKGTDPALQFIALGSGDLHVQVEVRQSTMADAYLIEVRAGRVVEAGRHEATTRIGWWYPSYAEKHCPGLPKWEALKRCATIFAPPHASGKGRLLGGPAEWDLRQEDRVKALELGFVVEHPPDLKSMWEEVARAIKGARPVLVFNWSPGWVEAQYSGRFVELPPYDRNCETDPTWGPNVDATYDCGYAADEPIFKAAWSGVPERWPCAYEFLKRMSFTTKQLSAFEYLVERRRLSPEQAAGDWLKRNEPIWRNWMPECHAG